MYSGVECVCGVTLSVYPTGQAEKSARDHGGKPKVAGSIPTVVRQIFQLARCGYILRITPQTHEITNC